MNNELITYINNARQSGKTDLEIKQELFKVGWQSGQIDGVFQSTGASPVPTPSTNFPVENSPWPYQILFISALIFGAPAAILTVWQNLKKIGENTVATKFLLITGAIFIVLIFFSGLFNFPKETGNVLAIAFPAWYFYKYGRVWEKEHPKEAKFSWSLIGWSLIGLAITFVLTVIFAIIVNLIAK